jgi:hypothetical protein
MDDTTSLRERLTNAEAADSLGVAALGWNADIAESDPPEAGEKRRTRRCLK